MVTVSIPLLLADLTGGARTAEVAGATLGEVLAALERLYPGMAARIQNDGKISPHVALTVDGKIAMQGLSTPVRPDSEVAILPSMGGG
jgi:molybdopterin synthase sulfur carrier subunit